MISSPRSTVSGCTHTGRVMLEATHDSIDGWPLGRAFPMHRPMQSITLQVILRTVFGVGGRAAFRRAGGRAAADARRHRPHPMFLLPLLQHDLGPLSPWGRFRREARRAGAILRSEIRRGREMGAGQQGQGHLSPASGSAPAGRTDVLAMMLDARDDKGSPLSEDEVHDELVTLLVAGHETTATALAWPDSCDGSCRTARSGSD